MPVPQRNWTNLRGMLKQSSNRVKMCSPYTNGFSEHKRLTMTDADFMRNPVIKKIINPFVGRRLKGRTIRKLMGAGGKPKKIRARENLIKKNSCTPINPKKYSCKGLKKIHTRNLITKKNSCGSKIPLPPPPITYHNIILGANKLPPKLICLTRLSGHSNDYPEYITFRCDELLKRNHQRPIFTWHCDKAIIVRRVFFFFSFWRAVSRKFILFARGKFGE